MDYDTNWLPVGTVAKLMDLNYNTIRYHLEQGDIPHQELGWFKLVRPVDVRAALYPPSPKARRKRTA